MRTLLARVLSGAVLVSWLTLPVVAQTGTPGCGINFDGNSRLSTPSLPTLQNAAEFTIEAWLAPTLAGTATTDYVVEKSGSYALRINNVGSYVFEATLDPAAQTYTVTSAVGVSYSTGIYHHVAVTFHGGLGLLRMFIDGVLASEVTGLTGKTLTQTTGNVRIGAQGGNPPVNGFTGKMDEIRIWSVRRPLTQIVGDASVPLRHVPNLELVISANGQQGASVPGSFIEASGHSLMTMIGNVTIASGMVCAPAHPGTGADLVQSSGLYGNIPSTDGNKAILGNTPIVVTFDSPGNTFIGDAFYWTVQAFPSGVPPAQTPGLDDVWIDLAQPITILVENAPLPPNGLTFMASAPPWAAIDAWSQGIILTSAVPTGYVTSDAHRFRYPEPIYADPSAPAGGNGTQGSPYNTLAAALAAAIPGMTIHLATGTFNETVTVTGAISVLGGYNPTTWALTNTRTIIRPDQGGMKFRDCQDAAVISGLDIRSAAGLSVGAAVIFHEMASIAVDIKNCSSGLQFTDCRFDSAGGANGGDGSNAQPAQAADGSNGANGQNGIYEASFPHTPRQGGNGAGNGGDGGNSGSGVCVNWIGSSCTDINQLDGHDGYDGNCGANGGNGGNSFQYGGSPGGWGTNGGAGAGGTNGAHGATNSPSGGVVNVFGEWVPNYAGDGSSGGKGCGGAGGGGGGCVGSATLGVNLGGGGGGGGEGGQGGDGGNGGQQGAPSVAAWLNDASPTFLSCIFLPGGGGNGGDGGNGQAGGDGGNGGNGGDFVATLNGTSGSGGWGGNGGDGGGGGGGAGACGGASWCVVLIGSSAPPNLTVSGSGNTFTPGNGGNGGAGGTRGGSASTAPSGTTGLSAILKTF